MPALLDEWIALDAHGLAGRAVADADGRLEYTREIIARHLDAIDQPTLITCLFGDEAGATLGYQRLGFTARAGLALALADARLQSA